MLTAFEPDGHPVLDSQSDLCENGVDGLIDALVLLDALQLLQHRLVAHLDPRLEGRQVLPRYLINAAPHSPLQLNQAVSGTNRKDFLT